MPVEVLKELSRAPTRRRVLELLRPDRDVAAGHHPATRTSSWRGSGRRAGRRSTSRRASSTTTTDPVAAGTVGEIVHRSPQAMVGYWDDPDKTAEAFRGGWFHSGDLGVLDPDGYLSIVDRKKDMIKSGGENVASREVEEVLFQHPAVAEAAVFGVPDPHWIEAVAAVVVLRPGHDGRAVRADRARPPAPRRVQDAEARDDRRRPAQEPQREDPQAPAARGVRPAGRAVRLGNVAGRAALVLGDEIADVETASNGRFGPDPRTVYDDWVGVPRVRRDGDRRNRSTARDRARLCRPDAAPGLRHRAELPPARRRDGGDRARRPGDVHEVPRQPGRSVRRHPDPRDVGRLGGRARRRHRCPRRAGGGRRWVVARRRRDGRPGHQRPPAAGRRGTAVLARQVTYAATDRWGRGW